MVTYGSYPHNRLFWNLFFVRGELLSRIAVILPRRCSKRPTGVNRHDYGLAATCRPTSIRSLEMKIVRRGRDLGIGGAKEIMD
jgi:hypothetical protein